MEGNVYDIGDTDHKFSIQSVSKVFTLAMVMQELGSQAVYDTVGVNATGRLFNSIIAIEDKVDRPSNPLVNAGAIATTSLVKGNSYDEKWNKIITTFSKFAGRDLGVDQEVYESEAATNQRNRAIAMLLDSYGRIYYDPLESVDIYTKQCAIAVDSHDLAVMAATLANGGVNPVTGVKLVEEEFLPKIFSVMATAGLYDDSGKWLYFVGLPGKSGVGGGVIAVAPGKFGIAAFSPRLDPSGNSQPDLFYAHLDVVPLPEESGDQREEDPWAGIAKDGYIWGRGVLDDKNTAKPFSKLQK
ncbi:unnamed protein product [Cyprideis torosa]|uniref:glutaminase n=1 Tax=Cyprideis torosa TaxID=163714 RepID=A0A7R8WU73_9CRUS|nr:unnamed protein product [Cyprideis torosa]CAG0906695.1 unnamed protein product [Cyprideis torosa]